MSRRDTMIIAVLVNAGLLIVLFSSALKSKIEAPVPMVVAEMPRAVAPLPVVVKEEVPVPQSVSKYVVAQSFAEDLKAFAAPEQPVLPPPVVVTPPVVVPSVLDVIEVKVKKGDVLEKLARHHQTSVAEIMQLNHLTNTNLRIGQTLKITNPASKKSEIVSQSPSHVTTVPTEADTSGSQYYTVKKGDNPWTIAVKNHMKVDELLKLNNLSEDQARRLKPGDQLRIR